MYIVDVHHYLDDRGAIAVQRGPARRMAEFVTAAIAHASDFGRPEEAPGPRCFKCRQRDDHRVQTGLTEDDAIAWACPACGVEGLISNWRGTFWDLSACGPDPLPGA